jgi:hypothetical protein
MKTIKSLKDITTLEVGDVVAFGTLKYRVAEWVSVCHNNTYFLYLSNNDKESNEAIFQALSLNKKDFVQNLGIDAYFSCDFPEVKSLEALTAIVSALFKEYEKQNELPKTWEEFCKRNPLKMGECLMGSYSNICITEAVGISRDADEDRNYYTSKPEAEAFLALMQLRQLRKCYVGDWEPNWENAYESKYCVNLVRNNFQIDKYWEASHVLSFPTQELAEQFLTNFKDLLEIAKPLL